MKRVKRLVLEKLKGSFIDGFNKLKAYAQELRDINLGSDVVIKISKDALEKEKRRFSRFYVCFQALKNGWKDGLRPFIGLDGTFLKEKCKGILLVALGQDSVKHFYPLAWAVVNRETTKTWKWFIELLRNSLELKDGEGLTLISDMQKGLIGVVGQLLPKAHHRWCVKHIEATWAKTWRGIHMKKLLWWSAWSTYEEEFVDQLKTMGSMYEQAVKDLLWYPAQYWCRAYFDTTFKNNICENNFTESFNKWILGARSKPIIKMLEDIRIKLQRGAQILPDMALSAPQSSQQSVFMPTPGFVPSFSQQTSQSSIKIVGPEAAGPSNLKRKSKDKHVVATSKRSVTKNVTTSSTTEQSVVASRALVDEDEDELQSEDETPLIRPRSISEAHTRLQVKKMHPKPTGSRKINFRGDESGTSFPIDLPYSPRKLTWKDKLSVTSNQLVIEKEKKIGKLKAKRSKNKELEQ